MSHSTDSISQIEFTEEYDMDEYEQYYEEDEVGSLFLVIILCVAMLFCFGVGVVVAVCIILIALGLLALGVLSTSVAVGLYKRSIASGFKTLVISTSTVGGSIIGALGIFILFKITHWGNVPFSTLAGAIGGSIAGLCFGFLAVFTIRKISKIISNKYAKSENNIES